MKKHRTSRHVILHIIIVLLLGVVLNVAVAWGTIFVQGDAFRMTPHAANIQQGIYDQPSGLRHGEVLGYVCRGCGWGYDRVEAHLVTRIRAGDERHFSRHDLSFLPSWATGIMDAAIPPDAIACQQVIDARGWPCLALRSHTFITLSESGVPQVRVDGGLSRQIAIVLYNDTVATNFALPTRIMPRGFAINSLLYAAASAALIAAPGAVRRQVRARRNRCVHCGYLLAGTPDRCPECGRERARRPRT
jgi:hypothetical protein